MLALEKFICKSFLGEGDPFIHRLQTDTDTNMSIFLLEDSKYFIYRKSFIFFSEGI